MFSFDIINETKDETLNNIECNNNNNNNVLSNSVSTNSEEKKKNYNE